MKKPTKNIHFTVFFKSAPRSYAIASHCVTKLDGYHFVKTVEHYFKFLFSGYMGYKTDYNSVGILETLPILPESNSVLIAKWTSVKNGKISGRWYYLNEAFLTEGFIENGGIYRVFTPPIGDFIDVYPPPDTI